MSRKTKKSEQKINPAVFLASLLIFAVGVGIFIYPAVSNLLAERQQRNTVYVYEQNVSALEQEEIQEQRELAETYNANLVGDELHDPFIQGSGYVIPDNYNEVLNLSEDGVMGYVDIPKIDVSIPIYHGTSEEILQKGAGHLEASSLPVGGTDTHSVISAHRGLPSAKLFTDLDELETGDVFYIHVLDEVLAYQVDQINTVDPDDLDLLRVVNGRDLVTLLTCTPYAVNTHRLLVRGTRIPYEEAKEVQEKAETGGNTISVWLREYFAAIFICVILLITIILIMKPWRKKKKGKRKR